MAIRNAIDIYLDEKWIVDAIFLDEVAATEASMPDYQRIRNYVKAKAAELATASAVAGEADLTDVVTAVSNAEMTLQTVVTVRDRVVAAYQEILRMPI